ncbi:MAG: protein phosphatase 2C domain-containing protein [Myxococcota bacterium]
MSDACPLYRVEDGEMDEVRVHPLGAGEVAFFSCRSPGRAGPNEDGLAVFGFEDAFVLAVADGMGGERAGAEAAHRAIEALGLALQEGEAEGGMLRTAILNGFERANQAVLEIGVGAGTTLAVVEVDGDRLRPYHVGDSMILQFGQRGRLKLQSVAHSPVGFALEAGVIDEGEAMHHEERHIVSNVLGADDMRIEMGSTRKLAARDTLLIASDGLADNLHTEEIVSLVCAGDLEGSAARLAELARTRMQVPADQDPSKPDDLSFIAFRPRRRRG